MDLFSVLTMFGGLALFIFGMHLMGEGLEKASSGKLERMLGKLTSSRMRGVLLGAGITAIIQSSSATTVTVVGFVNSGIMRLRQAIPVIMGANIGTTVTSWLLSLTGIESGNVLVRLLKPSSFSPILAVVGVCLLMFAKRGNRKDLGGIFIGFAILMFGMETMSATVKPLADVPEFQNILVMFENPLLGILTGTLLTAVIQSSSASVGILQALSVTGVITYGSAIPLIMGQNIGTCATALIACIGANKNARRAAVVHLYFNILGTLLFLGGYLLVDKLFSPALFAMPINVTGIAVVHSAFNLASTALLLPFTGFLEKLACLTVPDSKQANADSPDVLLDERLLATPAFALKRAKEITDRMADTSCATFLTSLALLNEYDEEKADEILRGEDSVDHYEDVLGTFMVKLSALHLSAAENKGVTRILHSIGEFERISDHAVNMKETAQEIHQKAIQFTAEARVELDTLQRAVEEVLDIAFTAFARDDAVQAKQVEPLEEVIDELIFELKSRHIERLQAGRCTVETGFVFADLLTNYERVADHCSNIAICLIEVASGEFNAHEYLIKRSEQQDFDSLYRVYKQRYALATAGEA